MLNDEWTNEWMVELKQEQWEETCVEAPLTIIGRFSVTMKGTKSESL